MSSSPISSLDAPAATGLAETQEMHTAPTTPVSPLETNDTGATTEVPVVNEHKEGGRADSQEAQPLQQTSIQLSSAVTEAEKTADNASSTVDTVQKTEALGPAVETTPSPGAESAANVSVLSITLMLTTGARHPYKIDEKYLKSRKVDVLDQHGRFDPREMSGYKLKELIWTDWRGEWEPRPASPSSIRLICMGRMLEDKSPLKDFPFKLDNINILHMTVKPADFLDDDEVNATSGKNPQVTRMRDGEDTGSGCRCVIL